MHRQSKTATFVVLLLPLLLLLHLGAVVRARTSIFNPPDEPNFRRAATGGGAASDLADHAGYATGSAMATPVTSIAQIPYQLAIIHTHTGGVILTPWRCLTVAHCVAQNKQALRPEDVHLLAGTAKRGDTAGGLYVAVSSVRLHPKWTRQNVRHDLAILIPAAALRRPDGTVLPVPQPTGAAPKYVTCTASGWGATQFTPEPAQLHQTLVRTISRSDCLEMWTTRMKVQVAPEYLCGTGVLDVADSGGPLICNGVLAGVVSFGSVENHTVEGAPLVFMDVWKERAFVNGAPPAMGASGLWAIAAAGLLMLAA